MASANWKRGKCHGATEAKSKLFHDDKKMRLEHEHSNKHINKELTPYNYSYFGLTYAEKCKRYDAAVEKASKGVRMSSGKNANVTMQKICVYPPDAIVDDADKLKAWYMRVGDMAVERWGDNVIELDVHVDEIHKYTDKRTKKEKLSKVHGHLSVVPTDVKTGKLNGMKFSAKYRIIDWNNALEQMTQDEFGCQYNTHDELEGEYLDIEELKGASQKLAVEMGADEILKEAEDVKAKAEEMRLDAFRKKRKNETDELKNKRKEDENKRKEKENEAEKKRLAEQRKKDNAARNDLNADKASWDEYVENYKADVKNELETENNALCEQLKKQWREEFQKQVEEYIQKLNDAAATINKATKAYKELIKLGEQKEAEQKEAEQKKTGRRQLDSSFTDIWEKYQQLIDDTGKVQIDFGNM